MVRLGDEEDGGEIIDRELTPGLNLGSEDKHLLFDVF